MKKIIVCAIGLAVAFSLFGGNAIFSLFQTIPVTVAQASILETAAPAQPAAPEFRINLPLVSAPSAAVQIETPIAVETTAVAAESISIEATRTADQVLLDQFIETVSGRQADQVTGLYIPGKFSLPVVQQPAGDHSYVSAEDHTVTQFGMANGYGTVGLLAHNYLSGKLFFDLHEGDQAVIVYGNGSQEWYRIVQFERYQALSPASMYSDFINLNDPSGATVTAGQVFQQIYTTENRVVFQTCTEANGNPSWGRLFVIAKKINQ